MSQSTETSMHIKMYEELIHGKYRPNTERYSIPDQLNNFIFEANVTVINLSRTDDFSENVNNIDFALLGFKNVTDAVVDIIDSSTGKKIIIKPCVIYKTSENEFIPGFCSVKYQRFEELIFDEYERLKVRAERELEIGNSNSIKLYAEKHLAKTTKLLEDGFSFMQELIEDDDFENFQILYLVNKVLLQIIKFFSQLFRPFVSLNNFDYTKNKLKLYKKVSLCYFEIVSHSDMQMHLQQLKKSCHYKQNEKNIDLANKQKSMSVKKSFEEYVDLESDLPFQSLDTAGNFSFEKKSFNDCPEFPSFRKLIWNGQINVLVDLFLQLTAEYTIRNKPILESSIENIIDWLLYIFVDEEGNPLSRNTLITLFKPYRFDKRIHPENPKRIRLRK